MVLGPGTGVDKIVVSRPSASRYHQYKFIVDGEWRHDETQPFMPDPLGNVNNWLYVRQPDAAGCAPLPEAGQPFSPGRCGIAEAHVPGHTHCVCTYIGGT